MINMETLFKNHFNTNKISDDDIQKFAEINLQRTSANNDVEEEKNNSTHTKKKLKGCHGQFVIPVNFRRCESMSRLYYFI